MKKLYNHQQKLVDLNPLKHGLFFTTGGGKTLTALSLAKGHTVVVTTKTVRDSKTWEEEYENTDKTLKSLTVFSKEDFKVKGKVIDVCDTLILDEAHKFCGITPNTKSVKRVEYPKTSQLFLDTIRFIERLKPSRVYPCTATPIPQPMAVWGLLRILGYHPDFYLFRDKFYFCFTMGYVRRYKPRSDQYSKIELAKILQKIGTSGQLQDWFDVPEQTYIEKEIELTKEQSKALQEVRLMYPDPNVCTGKRHQIEQGHCDGVFYEENKSKYILELMQQFNKIIVFAKYTAQINHLLTTLKKEKPDHIILSMTGKTKDRKEVLDLAESSDKCVIVIQTEISEGYELPSFPVVVYASKSYSHTHNFQSRGRVLRSNKLKKNLYISLHAGIIDKAVSDCLENKQDFQEKLYKDYEKA